jgi:hypothetical protein
LASARQINGQIIVTGGSSPTDDSTTTTWVSTWAPAHLLFSDPGTVTAGSPFSLTVTAQDASNHTATGYRGTVHFTASNGASADYTFTAADRGTHTFGGLVTPQPQTLAVTGQDTLNPAVRGSVTFTVAPAPAAPGAGGASPLTAADRGTHTSGGLGGSQAQTLAVTGQDTLNPAVRGSVTFTVAPAAPAAPGAGGASPLTAATGYRGPADGGGTDPRPALPVHDTGGADRRVAGRDRLFAAVDRRDE